MASPSAANSPAPATDPAPAELKPQPERLYGRQRGHPLRARQQRLLDVALPRLRFTQPADPEKAFSVPVKQLFLEIGFGGGEHAADQAERHPDTGYIASEVFENGLCSLLSRLIEENPEQENHEATAPLPPNLRLWDEDARLLLQELPDACLDRAYLMFPDPWPKARHAKRRFVHPDNIRELGRVLKPQATWRIASDHTVYQEWVEEIMTTPEAQALFDYVSCVQERPADWSPTRYEAKAFREGRQPFYWIFRRRG
ncbi:tRNA (guanosine(46)-N7)-methyltransferase TrmB [Oecophyllibacter saccharovorans]|uniref:tRNA (guanine(46)-N(7))-methyltransferase TrmB n=1 Tax=Oecophyllibacter saccharovorans TaxID=2558360 RepID=UPI00114373B4|nr:tRNA (guanine(46)-N(7))-methyltransferase TrmB [Oecophyllibacter saccharovorans]QDH14934.1 tRNA (guanosine(46)-N7)-methyltransferase TrmB [Oecophyllibacter saccharovorans]